jgi:polar amino acid transport system permease protein
LLTVELALVSLPFGIGFGLLLAFAKNSQEITVRFVGHAVTTVFRGLPELLTLLLVFFGGQIVLREISHVLNFAGVVEIDGFFAGVVALAVVFGAYASEVFLGALRALSKGQLEAARALGLKRWQTLRFVRFPELLRLSLPGLSNLWLTLLKQTSLVAVIAYDELLRKTYIAASTTHRPIFFYAVACLLYLLLTALSAGLLHRLDVSLNRGLRSL